MTNTEAARLCCQIVKSHFGPLTAKVAHVLITRGRLSVPNVIRFSQLKPRTVRAAIIVLIQHNLIRHFKSEEEGETLHFDEDECLTRLRFGQLVQLANQLHGEEAATIIMTLLDHGKLPRQEIINHAIENSSSDTKSYHTAFETLLKESFLCASTAASHLSPIDRLMQLEAEERAAVKGIPAAKQLREIQEKAKIRLNAEDAEISKLGMQPQLKSLKRKADGITTKEYYYRVNYGKFNIHIRNKLLITSARETFNEATSQVLAAILRAAQTKSIGMGEPRSDPVSITSIAAELNEVGDLAKGLSYKSKQKLSASSLVKEYIGWLAASDNPSPSGRAGSHISLLGTGKVQVEYEVILHRLRLKLLENIIRERHGGDAVRLVRVLLDHGKMDEKHLAKVAMMTNKEVRPMLASLSGEGLVTLQDVPKGNDRNPNRTFYLWYTDLDKAFAALTRILLKTQFNTLVRHEHDSTEPLLRSILDKCERSDVAADPNLLAPSEREVLDTWVKNSTRYSAIEARIEQSLFILRDCNLSLDLKP